MRVKAATIQQCMLGLALIAGLCWNLAHAAEVRQIRLQADPTGTRAEVGLDRESPYQVISLANPDRLVIDLPASKLGANLAFPDPAGLVKGVRSGTPIAGTVRIVFDLASPVVAMKPRIENGASGPMLVLEWPDDGVGRGIAGITAAPSPAVAAASAPAQSPAATLSPQRSVSQPQPAATAGSVDSPAASTTATERLIASLPAHQRTPAPTPATPAGTVQPSSGTAAVGPSPTPGAGQPSVPGAMPTASVASGAIVPNQTRIATGIPTRVATGVPAPAPGATAPVPSQPQMAMRPGMRPLVVAIDPGHGGQDSGAVGLTGKREKDIVLMISRELARQVNATPGLRAFLTRDSDVFIPLPRRAQLARAAKADIFVSIHADAAENRNAQGSSVYVLSLRGASSQRARWLADKENSADLIGGVRIGGSDNTLASVLLDLTQSGHMKASEDAAEHVLDGLKLVGNNHKPEIERANFAVLRTSDMPSMLVETAFISNPEEERRLSDPTVQRSLATAVLGGINAYFTSQPPPGTLYAARAMAGGADDGGSGSRSSR